MLVHRICWAFREHAWQLSFAVLFFIFIFLFYPHRYINTRMHTYTHIRQSLNSHKWFSIFHFASCATFDWLIVSMETSTAHSTIIVWFWACIYRWLDKVIILVCGQSVRYTHVFPRSNFLCSQRFPLRKLDAQHLSIKHIPSVECFKKEILIRKTEAERMALSKVSFNSDGAEKDAKNRRRWCRRWERRWWKLWMK